MATGKAKAKPRAKTPVKRNTPPKNPPKQKKRRALKPEVTHGRNGTTVFYPKKGK